MTLPPCTSWQRSSNRMAPVIGVFDSGFGGLTVLRELRKALPAADYLYFGDTAHLPYGAKSVRTVAKYAIASAHFLELQGIDLLVVACNTATALALDDIRAALKVPVVGVVQRSEEHTSELQSRENLVCRLLLEKKKTPTRCNHRGDKRTT